MLVFMTNRIHARMIEIRKCVHLYCNMYTNTCMCIHTYHARIVKYPRKHEEMTPYFTDITHSIDAHMPHTHTHTHTRTCKYTHAQTHTLRVVLALETERNIIAHTQTQTHTDTNTDTYNKYTHTHTHTHTHATEGVLALKRERETQ